MLAFRLKSAAHIPCHVSIDIVLVENLVIATRMTLYPNTWFKAHEPIDVANKEEILITPIPMGNTVDALR
jgi:hypothetical protein